ncbi:MAG: hypothetical protein JWO85_220 [Candidatus Eremiobacteraeota bacterium]|nr:hypothetical protein [Candidatus Eremiobacteraeota bacterium]
MKDEGSRVLGYAVLLEWAKTNIGDNPIEISHRKPIGRRGTQSRTMKFITGYRWPDCPCWMTLLGQGAGGLRYLLHPCAAHEQVAANDPS